MYWFDRKFVTTGHPVITCHPFGLSTRACDLAAGTASLDMSVAHPCGAYEWQPTCELHGTTSRECANEDWSCYQSWPCAPDRWPDIIDAVSPRTKGSTRPRRGHRPEDEIG